MNSTEVQNSRRELDNKCLCSSYVFGSVQSLLTCFRSSLTHFVDFVSNNSFSDSKLKAFHCVLRLPKSSKPSIACTTVLHCGHTFLNHSVTNVQVVWKKKKHNTTCSSDLITHYCYIHVMERYTDILHMKKIADLVTVSS